MKSIVVALVTLVVQFSFLQANVHASEVDEIVKVLEKKGYIDNVVVNKALVVYTVGSSSDTSCQYSLLQDAIDAANNTLNTYEIRVASNKTYTESLVLDWGDLTITGGFANCSDASSNTGDGSKTTLDATGLSLPVMLLKNSDTTKLNTYNISNFEITGGVGNDTYPGGGINILDNSTRLNLENSLIHANTGIKGGGLYTQGSGSAFINDTLIILNTATNGGGVYCGGDNSLFIYGNSGVSSNNANGTSFDGNGGGLYLTNLCRLDFWSGTAGGAGDLRGISGNAANRNGGGMYLDSGSVAKLWGYVVLFGNNTAPVNITNNTANVASGTASGGGIYATGATTLFEGHGVIINNNEVSAGVSSSAGGVALDQAKFVLSRLDDQTCWNTQKCNQMIGNKVSGANATAAGIQAITGADVSIKNTWISGHNSSSSAFMYAQDATVTIEGNIFTGNGGTSTQGNTSLIYLYGSSSNASIVYNSFVNNQLNTALLRINVDPTVLFFANIVKESNTVNILETVTGGSTNSQFKCLVVHEDQSFTGTTVVLANPQFVDEANEDFHIASSSPAIDLCGTDYATPAKDLDETDRGWDDLLTGNTLGVFDAGADEYYPATTADLSVTKTITTAAPFAANDTINYAIVVSNAGPDSATNVRVEDTPSGMTLSTVQSTNCSGFPCTIASLASGASETITVTAQLRATPGSFDNSVMVYSEDYDADMSNNTDNTGNAGVVGQDSVDMAVTFSLSDSGPYNSGQILTYQASITNNGPSTANNVVISGTYLNTEVISISGSSCVTLPCSIATFASGATVDMAFSVRILSGGTFNFGIDVTTDSLDTDSSNNSGIVADNTAKNTADMSIDTSITTMPDYLPGSYIEVVITMYNAGPEVGDAQISTTLNNLQFVSLIGASCTSFPCYMGDLGSGSYSVLTITYYIPNSGNFSVDASISSFTAFDPDSTNNSSFVEDVASSVADLSTTVTMVTTQGYYISQQVELLATVTNNGPDISDLVDLQIGGTNIVIDSVSGVNCNTTTCQMAALNNGGTHQVTILGTITDPNSFQVTAQSSSFASDPDANNNSGVYNGVVSARPELVFSNSFE